MITAEDFIDRLNSAWLTYYHSIKQHSNAENFSAIAEMLESASTLALLSLNKGRDSKELSKEESDALYVVFEIAGKQASLLKQFIENMEDD